MIDALVEIGKFLNDKEKICLCMVSKLTDTLKYKFMYSNKINVKKIMGLPYFDNFENVEINHYEDIQPNRVKYVHFITDDTNVPSFVTHFKFYYAGFSVVEIPLSVTHLKITYYFDILNIPHSVTHLTTFYLNYMITNHKLPSVTHYTYNGGCNVWLLEHLPSVTHLIFHDNFNSCLFVKMPQTITHITFNDKFNTSIDSFISPSVTHLRFGANFNKSIDNLPETIVQIELPATYNIKIREGLISKIIRR